MRRKNIEAESKNTRRNSQYETKASNTWHGLTFECTTGKLPPMIKRKREYDGEIIEEWVIDNERKDHFNKPIMSSKYVNKCHNDYTLEMVQTVRKHMVEMMEFFMDLYFYYSSQHGTIQLLLKIFENKNRNETVAASMKRMNSMSLPSNIKIENDSLATNSNSNASDHEYMMTAIKLYKISNPSELTKADAKDANIMSKYFCAVLLQGDLTVLFQTLLRRLNYSPPSQAVTRLLDAAIDNVGSKYMPEYMKQASIDKLKTALKSSEFSKVTNVLLSWSTIITQRRNTFILPSTSDNMSTIDIKKIFTHSRNLYDLYYFICKSPLKFKPEQTEFYTFMTFSAQNKNYIFDVIQYTNNYKLKCSLDEMSWYQRLELAKSIKTTDDIVITVNPISIDEINFDQYPSGVMGTYYIRTVGTGYGTLFVKYPAENNRKRSANTSSMLNKRHKKQKFQDMVPGIANKEMMLNQPMDENSLRAFNNNGASFNNMTFNNTSVTVPNNNQFGNNTFGCSTFNNNNVNSMLNPFSMYLAAASQIQTPQMDYQALQQQQFQQAIQQALFNSQMTKQQQQNQVIWGQPPTGYLQPTRVMPYDNGPTLNMNFGKDDEQFKEESVKHGQKRKLSQSSENGDNSNGYKDYGEMNMIKQSDSGNPSKVIISNF